MELVGRRARSARVPHLALVHDVHVGHERRSDGLQPSDKEVIARANRLEVVGIRLPAAQAIEAEGAPIAQPENLLVVRWRRLEASQRVERCGDSGLRARQRR
eukprot:3596473-Prymnesium_polylepis.1